jgi:hypothetical protein
LGDLQISHAMEPMQARADPPNAANLQKFAAGGLSLIL